MRITVLIPVSFVLHFVGSDETTQLISTARSDTSTSSFNASIPSGSSDQVNSPSRLLFILRNKTFEDAQEYCKMKYGHLLDVDCATEACLQKIFLANNCTSSYDAYWVGLRFHDDKWKWSHDGWREGFQIVTLSLSSDVEGDCVKVDKNLQLHREPCDTELPFICRISNQIIATSTAKQESDNVTSPPESMDTIIFDTSTCKVLANGTCSSSSGKTVDEFRKNRERENEMKDGEGLATRFWIVVSALVLSLLINALALVICLIRCDFCPCQRRKNRKKGNHIEAFEMTAMGKSVGITKPTNTLEVVTDGPRTSVLANSDDGLYTYVDEENQTGGKSDPNGDEDLEENIYEDQASRTGSMSIMPADINGKDCGSVDPYERWDLKPRKSNSIVISQSVDSARNFNAEFPSCVNIECHISESDRTTSKADSGVQPNASLRDIHGVPSSHSMIGYKTTQACLNSNERRHASDLHNAASNYSLMKPMRLESVLNSSENPYGLESATEMVNPHKKQSPQLERDSTDRSVYPHPMILQDTSSDYSLMGSKRLDPVMNSNENPYGLESATEMINSRDKQSAQLEKYSTEGSVYPHPMILQDTSSDYSLMGSKRLDPVMNSNENPYGLESATEMINSRDKQSAQLEKYSTEVSMYPHPMILQDASSDYSLLRSTRLEPVLNSSENPYGLESATEMINPHKKQSDVHERDSMDAILFSNVIIEPSDASVHSDDIASVRPDENASGNKSDVSSPPSNAPVSEKQCDIYNSQMTDVLNDSDDNIYGNASSTCTSIINNKSESSPRPSNTVNGVSEKQNQSDVYNSQMADVLDESDDDIYGNASSISFPITNMPDSSPTPSNNVSEKQSDEYNSQMTDVLDESDDDIYGNASSISFPITNRPDSSPTPSNNVSEKQSDVYNSQMTDVLDESDDDIYGNASSISFPITNRPDSSPTPSNNVSEKQSDVYNSQMTDVLDESDDDIYGNASSISFPITNRPDSSPTPSNNVSEKQSDVYNSQMADALNDSDDNIYGNSSSTCLSIINNKSESSPRPSNTVNGVSEKQNQSDVYNSQMADALDESDDDIYGNASSISFPITNMPDSSPTPSNNVSEKQIDEYNSQMTDVLDESDDDIYGNASSISFPITNMPDSSPTLSNNVSEKQRDVYHSQMGHALNDSDDNIYGNSSSTCLSIINNKEESSPRPSNTVNVASEKQNQCDVYNSQMTDVLDESDDDIYGNASSISFPNTNMPNSSPTPSNNVSEKPSDVYHSQITDVLDESDDDIYGNASSISFPITNRPDSSPTPSNILGSEKQFEL